ncbi:Na(+)/H(+) antiporter subunit B [Oxalobacteraceae bacterium R-40]|uniref:Na(+)/H(+) antiporter subunit B n=1 Tax=Keguizhuia sedimenti TaxID=3064264 RepID=A0ABU1BRN4_9BURK|nr:Na(+)/H(+) antiporter subunit B [Oxalobacteraceae bacterium R-40]
MKFLQRLSVLLGCAALGLLLAMTLLDLPLPQVRLSEQVHRQLHASGVDHPVTAVLLNFRGYDTLLEIAVLFLALLGVLLVRDEPSTGYRIGGSAPLLLQLMAKLTAPMMILVAGYLLWAGAYRPGGAFQSGAVLASGMVLLYLSCILPAWASLTLTLRIGTTIGFLIFLGVAAAMLSHGMLLQYPPSSASTLILLIETGLTVSLGLILAGLFLWQPNEEDDA